MSLWNTRPSVYSPFQARTSGLEEEHEDVERKYSWEFCSYANGTIHGETFPSFAKFLPMTGISASQTPTGGAPRNILCVPNRKHRFAHPDSMPFVWKHWRFHLRSSALWHERDILLLGRQLRSDAITLVGIVHLCRHMASRREREQSSFFDKGHETAVSALISKDLYCFVFCFFLIFVSWLYCNTPFLLWISFKPCFF